MKWLQCDACGRDGWAKDGGEHWVQMPGDGRVTLRRCYKRGYMREVV